MNKNVPFFQSRKQTGQLTGLLDHRAARVLNVHAHRVGDDVGERRLAESRRTAQQNMLEHVASFFGGLHHELQSLTHFHLAGELAEQRRPQRNFESGIRFWWFHTLSVVVLEGEAVELAI